jgi:hypothetical protein
MQDTSPNLKIGAWCETCKDLCYFDPEPVPPVTWWRKTGRFLAAVATIVGSLLMIAFASIGATAVAVVSFLYFSG